MKEIKSYIDESLFGGTSTDDRAESFNNSFKLSVTPKNEADYLNYVTAWARIFNTMSNMWRAFDFNNEKDFVAYAFSVYFENLPDYHVDMSKADPQPKFTGTTYDAIWDSQVVVRGAVSYNKNLVNTLINKLINGKPSRGLIEKLGEIALSGRESNATSREKYYLERREGALDWGSYDRARQSNYGEDVENYTPEEYDIIVLEVDTWIHIIHQATKRGPYKKASQRLFDAIY